MAEFLRSGTAEELAAACGDELDSAIERVGEYMAKRRSCWPATWPHFTATAGGCGRTRLRGRSLVEGSTSGGVTARC